jgi:hypothetical protein
MFDHIYVCRYTTWIINIFGYILLRIVYFENIHRDKSNNISYTNICMSILEEKYGQNISYE